MPGDIPRYGAAFCLVHDALGMAWRAISLPELRQIAGIEASLGGKGRPSLLVLRQEPRLDELNVTFFAVLRSSSAVTQRSGDAAWPTGVAKAWLSSKQELRTMNLACLGYRRGENSRVVER